MRIPARLKFPRARKKHSIRKFALFGILFLSLVSIPGVKDSFAFNPEKIDRFGAKRLLYLPLDERFTTRDLFLSFAQVTPFRVVTPVREMLPQRKKSPPDMRALLDWMIHESASAAAAVISSDMLLYGGLIASRISHDSLEEIRTRLKVLENIRRRNPKLPISVSTTVMRMPAYSSAEEEPDYYAQYGRQIFLFSQHTHRYEVTKDSKDKALAEDYKKQIPESVLADYLSRRRRNFSVNKELVELVKRNVIDRLVITLDDNAEYGLFKKEAAELERLAVGYEDRIAIYPGADEAQLPLLSRLVLEKKRLKVFVAYRFSESKKLIPAFEGQPLDESVKQQILAAGGVITDEQEKAEVVLYVNNFKDRQTFPPKNQTGLAENVEPLEKWLRRAGIRPENKKILILADNYYYNGSDPEMIASLLSSKLESKRISYAGWNTSGNTLGSAIAWGLLRHEMSEGESILSHYKKLLFVRLMEDWVYMVEGREQIRNDLKKRNLSGFENSELEREYERQMKNLFDSRTPLVNRFLKTDFSVKRVFFPWHRTFEIGLEID